MLLSQTLSFSNNTNNDGSKENNAPNELNNKQFNDLCYPVDN